MAADIGFEAIRKNNRACWAELWKSRIRLVGAEKRWQAMADAAFFYLMSTAHTSSPSSTSMFGLATWHDYHYYFGHVMWDIEPPSVQPPAGPFFANLGGFLLGLILGFPKIQPGPENPQDWCKGAVVLPAGWRSIEIDRIWWQALAVIGCSGRTPRTTRAHRTRLGYHAERRSGSKE